jgi:hypothetical protein
MLVLGVLLTAGFAASGAFGRVSLLGSSTETTPTATDQSATETDGSSTDGATAVTTSTTSDPTDTSTTDAGSTETTTTTAESPPLTTPGAVTPTITTDKADYAPGSTVTVTGQGWGAGESIHLFVNDDVGQTWSLNADVLGDFAGTFAFQFQLPNYFVADYTVTTTGSAGGMARAAFTDGNATGATLSIRKSNCTDPATSFIANDTVCAHSVITTVTGGGTGNIFVEWINPSNVTVSTTTHAGLPNDAFNDSLTIAALGTWTVKVCTNSSCNTNQTLATGTFTVAAKQNQTITVNTHAPSSAAYNASFTVAATASSGLPVSYSSTGSCSNVGATFTITSGSGTCSVKYDQPGNGSFNAAPQITENVTANKAAQSISVTTHAPASATYGSSFTVAASGGGSGNPVTFSRAGSCSNAGATFTITSGSGTCTVKYDQAGNANFDPAPQLTETVNATKASQVITVTTHAPANATFNSSFTVAATGGGSGNLVTFSSAGSCSNAGATFTMTSGTGTCTVQYDQAGNANFDPASQVTESASATKASQTVTFAPLTGKTFGDPDFNVGASASSGLAVSFSVGTGDSCTIAGSTVHITGAGSCTVTASQGGNTNYGASPDVPRMFAIAKASQTISFDALADRTYGEGPVGLSASSTSGLAVGFAAAGPCTIVSGPKVRLDGAGECTVTAFQTGDDNWNAADAVSHTFTIGKADLSISADDKAITYPADRPAFTVSYDGFVNSEGPGNLGGSLGCDTSPASTATSPDAGSYTITCSGQTSDDYAIHYHPGTLMVHKGDQTISFDTLANHTYGDNAVDLNASASSGLTVNLATDGNCTIIAGPKARIDGAGTCTITASQPGNDNWSAADAVSHSFTITTAPLTITASSPDDVVYGAARPAVTASYDGFVSGDGPDSLTTKPSCGTAYSSGDDVGTYATSCSGAESPDYDIHYVAGSFDVLKKALTITASSPDDIVYGDAAPAVTVSYEGFISGDNADSLTTKHSCGSGYTVGSPVGTYTTTCSGAEADNYAINYVDGSFHVLKKALTITASSPDDITYGDAAPAVTPSYDGFITGDDADSLTTKPGCGSGYSAGSPVGNYTTTCSGATSGNYDIGYVDGSFTVLKKTLTITASSPDDITYGDAAPAVTPSYDGFITGDDADSLITKPTCGTGYSLGDPVGHYDTSCIGAASGNYKISYIAGGFDVTKKALTLTASSPDDIIYGSPKPSISASADGLVAGDSLADLDVDCTTSYSAGDSIGTYITSCAANGGRSGNYDINYVNGSFKVLKKALTITASSPDDLIYGDAAPAVTPSYDGFITGDNVDSLSTKPSCGSGYAVGSPVGTYTTTCSDAEADNYEISYVDGSFKVLEKALTITASSPDDIVYGAAKPSIAASADGLTAGDTLGDLNVDCTTAYAAGDAVGTYETMCSAGGGKTGNYNITHVAGSFHVLKKALTITASSPDDITYGDAAPTVTASYDGFISGDNADSLSTKPTCGSGYAVGSPVGTYTTTCSGAEAHNYDIGYIDGSFKVLKKALSITASSPDDIVYGSAKPSVSPIYDGFISGDDADSLITEPTCDTGYTLGDPVGHYTTGCTGATSGNYDISSTGGGFDVTKKALTITASSPADIVYGSAKPTVTPSYDGLISGDGPDTLAPKPTCATSYAAGNDVGPYTTTCAGAGSPNYEISYVAGSFTVLKKALTITASSPADIVYGSAKPAVSPIYDGFISGDDASKLTTQPSCGTAYSLGEGVGTYATTCAGATAGNYDISYVAGSFTVTKKALTITASSPADIVYGSAKPTITAAPSGLVAGDTLVDLNVTCGTPYSAGNAVGTYATSCAASGGRSGNYDITYVGGSFKATKKSLTITASSPIDIVYGSARPGVTATPSGLVAGDTLSDLNVACTTPYSPGDPIGTYGTSCAASGGKSGNYDITYVGGSFKVTKKSLTITASSPADIVYGSPKPTVNAGASGLIAQDTLGDLNVSCTTPYSAGDPVGTYATSCAASGGKSGDYDITYVTGSFNVTKKTLTITASSPAEITYGAPTPAVTPLYSGFITGQDANNLSTKPTCGTSYTPASPVGTYATTCSGAASGNYSFVYVPGSFKVVYGWSGFLQPINDTAHFVSLSMSVFKAGSTIPVKFQLTNAAGGSVQAGALPQWVSPTVVGTTAAPVDETVFTDPPSSGSTYRSDGQQYIFNWQSPKTDAGKIYRIGVRLDDGRTYYVNIGLK